MKRFCSFPSAANRAFPWLRLLILLLVLLMTGGLAQAENLQSITDALGRQVKVPTQVDRLLCSGPGCLRLLTYLQAQDMVVGVDDIEGRRSKFDARPYAIANPQFKKLPVFGEFRGKDDPERILSLPRQPQVIFKTYARVMGYDPDELQQKTGIPVVAVNYGGLSKQRPVFFGGLRLMGKIINKEARAEEVVSFFENTIADLQNRSSGTSSQPTVFVGGISMKGAHGFQSTEPVYPPFLFVNARNLAFDKKQAGKKLRMVNISKEQIIAWDPDLLFVDLSTLQMGKGAGGVHELHTDAAYQSLSAIKTGKVYGLLPYNWYSKNYGSILANAYYIGKLLHPERFKDIDPAAKADEIYTFLVGKPVYDDMSRMFKDLAFAPLPIK